MGKRAAKEAEAEARRGRCLELRKAGLSYQQIADQIGCSKAQAFRDVEKLLKRLIEDNRLSTEQYRGMELERLDDMERAARRVLGRRHVAINNGRVVVRSVVADTGEVQTVEVEDDEPVLRAVRTLLAVSERRARLLGLDAPTKVESTDTVESVIRVVRVEPRPKDVEDA